MGNPFGNASLSNEGLEESQDRLGGFQPRETDIYTGKVKAFYAGEFGSGAKNVTIIFDDGKEYRETITVTNKKGDNFFLNKDDNTKKVPLPGFTIVDEICLCTSGKPLADQTWEEKVIKLYDFDEKKEMNKSVWMAMDVVGQTISLGIQKNHENKSERQGTEYVPTDKEIFTNNIEKVFHTESKGTVVEARNNQTSGAFWDAWLERNKGATRDKRTIKDGKPTRGGTGGNNAAAPQPGAGSTAAPKTSLFAKN